MKKLTLLLFVLLFSSYLCADKDKHSLGFSLDNEAKLNFVYEYSMTQKDILRIQASIASLNAEAIEKKSICQPAQETFIAHIRVSSLEECIQLKSNFSINLDYKRFLFKGLFLGMNNKLGHAKFDFQKKQTVLLHFLNEEQTTEEQSAEYFALHPSLGYQFRDKKGNNYSIELEFPSVFEVSNKGLYLIQDTENTYRLFFSYKINL